MRDGDHHLLFGDEVLDGELRVVAHDFGAPFIAETLGHLEQLALEDVHAARLALEDATQIGDGGADLGQLLLELVALETGELGEPHVEDRLGLPLAEPEPALQLCAGRGGILRRADEGDDLVDVVDGDLEPLEDVLPFERLVEVELRAAHDDFVPVLDIVLEALLEREHLGHQLPRVRIGDQREHDHAKRALHGRVLVQLVEHHTRNGIALELHHHPHAVTIGLVTQRADAGELLFAHQLGDVLHELGLVHLVRQFGDDDL